MNVENITRFRTAVETVGYARNSGDGSVTLAQVDELTEAANLADRELYQAERTITQLNEQLADETALRGRMSALLTGVANALKGQPDPLTMHDWSDLPEVAAAVMRGETTTPAP